MISPSAASAAPTFKESAGFSPSNWLINEFTSPSSSLRLRVVVVVSVVVVVVSEVVVVVSSVVVVVVSVDVVVSSVVVVVVSVVVVVESKNHKCD